MWVSASSGKNEIEAAIADDSASGGGENHGGDASDG